MTAAPEAHAPRTTPSAVAHRAGPQQRLSMTDHLRVEPWPDPVVDRHGHDPRSLYVERYWLGVLGPSTTWLLRSIADRFDAEPDGFTLDLTATAGALGLGMKRGRHGPFMRALDRLCQFGLARELTPGLMVRRVVPPVTQGQLKRLPGHLQQAHADWHREQLRDRTTDGLDDREHKARRLALTLLEIGEDVSAAERQLQAWRVEPPTATRALRWAHERHRAAAEAVRSEGAA